MAEAHDYLASHREVIQKALHAAVTAAATAQAEDPIKFIGEELLRLPHNGVAPSPPQADRPPRLSTRRSSALGARPSLRTGRSSISASAAAAPRLSGFRRSSIQNVPLLEVPLMPLESTLTTVQAAFRGAQTRSRMNVLRQRLREAGKQASISKFMLTNALKNRSDKELRLASGHADTFWRASSNIIIKDTSIAELNVYEALQGSALQPFLPALYGANQNTASDRHALLHLEDLTSGYRQPCIMDVKVGIRTFLEKEVTAAKLRPDLAEKIHKLDPAVLSEEERQKGVTKLRYMQFREERSSSASLGWRIEGWVLPEEQAEATPKVDFKNLREPDELRATLEAFTQTAPAVRAAFTNRLEELRSVLEGSSSGWFQEHEVVSSSLLFIFEGDQHAREESRRMQTAGVYMIDFAKTTPIPEGLDLLTHRTPWEAGNHEDGYLLGLDSLIQTWRQTLDSSR